MRSAQGQWIQKGNFGLACDLLSCVLPLCLFLSLTWTHTHSPSAVPFYFAHSLLPSASHLFCPSLPHKVHRTQSVLLSESSLFLTFPPSLSLSFPSFLTLFLSRTAKEVSLHIAGARRRLRCNNWIIEQSANKHETQSGRSIRNGSIIWGGQRQSKHGRWIKSSKQLAVQD